MCIRDRVLGGVIIAVPALLATGGYIQDVEATKRTLLDQQKIIQELQSNSQKIAIHLAIIEAELTAIRERMDRDYEQKRRNH
mgnify:FL=1